MNTPFDPFDRDSWEDDGLAPENREPTRYSVQQEVLRIISIWSEARGAGSQAFPEDISDDLSTELWGLACAPHYEKNLAILRHVAENCAKQPDTLSKAASILCVFNQFRPQDPQIEQLKSLVVSASPIAERREQDICLLSDLIKIFDLQRFRNIECDQMLAILERGMKIVTQAPIVDWARDSLASVLACLVGNTGSFHHAVNIIRLLETNNSKGQLSLIAETLKAGISCGDSVQKLCKVTKALVSLIGDHAESRNLVLRVVHGQEVASGSILAALNNLHRNYSNWDERLFLKSTLKNYEAACNHLIDRAQPLDLINQDYLNRFVGSHLPSFQTNLEKHIRKMREVVREAEISRAFDKDSIALFASLGGAYPHPQISSMLLFVIKNADSHVDRPDKLARNLHKLVGLFSPSPNQYDEILGLLEIQVNKGSSIDGVIESILAVVVRCHATPTNSADWDAYVRLCKSLSGDISDLAFVTVSAVDEYLRDTSTRGTKRLTELLCCASELAEACGNPRDSADIWVKKVLREDLLGECLVKAVRQQKTLGLSEQSLYESYLRLTEELPKSAVFLLRKIVHYQIAQGHEVGQLFETFADCGKAIRNGALPKDFWKSARAESERLMALSVPLDFFGKWIVQQLSNSTKYDKALERASANLAVMLHLRATTADSKDFKAVSRLLARVGEDERLPAAVAALEALAFPKDQSQEAILPATFCDICPDHLSLSRSAWLALYRGVELYRKWGYGLDLLVNDIQNIDYKARRSPKKFAEIWGAANDIIGELQESGNASGGKGLPYHLITDKLISSYNGANSENQRLLIHLVASFLCFYDRSRGYSEPRGEVASLNSPRSGLSELSKILDNLLNTGHGIIDSPSMVHKFKLIIVKGGVAQLSDFRKVVQDLTMHALTDMMRNNPDPVRSGWAKQEISRRFNIGGAPYYKGSEDEQRHYLETMQVVDRAFRDSKGFGAEAIDTRGVPRSEALEPVPPMLVRFGLDSAERVSILNSRDNSKFPGKGLLISGIKTERVFPIDPHWQKRGKDSPHWRWLEGQGLFAKSYFHRFNMGDMSECSFLKMRGLKCVIPPSSEAYTIDKTHYSYLVYNNHFAPLTTTAIGVPSVVIWELLGNSQINALDYRGYEPTRDDLSNVDFSFRALTEICKRKRLNILDLTYGSVIGGGLCNAFLPKSKPHFTWEIDASAGQIWMDNWGHVHKSFITNSVNDSQIDDDPRIIDARVMHSRIFEVFRPLQDFAAAFDFARSFYKMGATFTNDSSSRVNEGDPEQEDLQSRDGDNEIQPAPRLAPHPYRFRMLEEAYRWHLGGRENGWSYEQFPELHFAWVLDPSSLPAPALRKFKLDLATMVLTTKDGEYQLPKDSNGSGERERRLWEEHVIPHFEGASTGWEPRFLLRGGAFSIQE
jgi:hypothetical protein